MTAEDCPYGAGNCPKISRVEKTTLEIQKTLNLVLKMLYITVGIVLSESGLMFL